MLGGLLRVLASLRELVFQPLGNRYENGYRLFKDDPDA